MKSSKVYPQQLSKHLYFSEDEIFQLWGKTNNNKNKKTKTHKTPNKKKNNNNNTPSWQATSDFLYYIHK